MPNNQEAIITCIYIHVYCIYIHCIYICAWIEITLIKLKLQLTLPIRSLKIEPHCNLQNVAQHHLQISTNQPSVHGRSLEMRRLNWQTCFEYILFNRCQFNINRIQICFIRILEFVILVCHWGLFPKCLPAVDLKRRERANCPINPQCNPMQS